MTPKIEVIERAMSFVSDGSLGQLHALVTTFGRLGGEVHVRHATLRAIDQSDPSSAEIERLAPLSRLFTYASLRQSDLFTRLSTVECLKEVFSERSGDDAFLWHSVGGLAIKDFHVDLSAVMDALAPVVIEATVGLKPKDREKLPAFPDIQAGAMRSYRDALPDPIRHVIDSTDRWWPEVKRVRDIVTHREHQKIAFGHANDGLLFQAYDSTMKPLVHQPASLVANGNSVAEFELYSTSLLAEVLVLMDELGRAISTEWGGTLTA